MAHPGGGKLVRPTVLTLEVQKSIVRDLGEGNYISVACQAAGIDVSTFYWWKSRYDEGDPDAQRFADFFEAVKRANAIAEVNSVREWRAAQPNWQAHAAFLERRWRRRWGRRDRAPAPPKPKKPLREMTGDELDRYERDLEGAD